MLLAQPENALIGNLPAQTSQFEQALQHTHRPAPRQMGQVLIVKRHWVAVSL